METVRAALGYNVPSGALSTGSVACGAVMTCMLIVASSSIVLWYASAPIDGRPDVPIAVLQYAEGGTQTPFVAR